MNYKVEVTSYFKKQSKRLIKKFPSLKQEILELISLLEKDPKQGTPIIENCFKIRLAISSKGKGKSGGARVITHVHYVRNQVFLLSIYDKSELSDIADKELKELVASVSE